MAIDAPRPVQDEYLETLATVEDKVGFVAALRLKNTFPVDNDGPNDNINNDDDQRGGCSSGTALGALSIGFLMAVLLASIMSQATSAGTAIYIGIICFIIIIGVVPLVLAYIEYRRKSSK